jgi:hypothetical protein
MKMSILRKCREYLKKKHSSLKEISKRVKNNISGTPDGYGRIFSPKSKP